MGSRHKAREAALKILYQADLRGEGEADRLIEEGFSSGAFAEGVERSFVEALARGVLSRLDEIDTKLAEFLDQWEPRRLGYMERAILRMGLYEIFFEAATPDKVAINEAVKLAKDYCDTESAGLINAVLDKALKEKAAGLP